MAAAPFSTTSERSPAAGGRLTTTKRSDRTGTREDIMKTLALAALTLAIALPAHAEDALKFGYINKMGDHPWFVREVAGAKAKAKELGVELKVQDVQFDA